MFRGGVATSVDQPVSYRAVRFQSVCVWEWLMQRAGGLSYPRARFLLCGLDNEPEEFVAEEFGLLHMEIRLIRGPRDAQSAMRETADRVPELRGFLEKLDIRDECIIHCEPNCDYREWECQDDGGPNRWDRPLWRSLGLTDGELGLVRYALRFRALQSRAGLTAAEASAYLCEALPETLADVAEAFGITLADAEEARRRAVSVVGREGLEAAEVPRIRRATPGPGETYTILPLDTPLRAAEKPMGSGEGAERAMRMRMEEIMEEFGDPQECPGYPSRGPDGEPRSQYDDVADMHPSVELLPFRLPRTIRQGLWDYQRIFVSDYFRDAPCDVLLDVFDESDNRLGRRNLPTTAGFSDLVRSAEFRRSNRRAALRRNPGLTGSPKGRHRDLSVFADGLSDRAVVYYDDSILLTWTSDWSADRFFERAAVLGIAAVPDALDRPEVPPSVLEYAVFCAETRCQHAGCPEGELREALERFPRAVADRECSELFRKLGMLGICRWYGDDDGKPGWSSESVQDE